MGASRGLHHRLVDPRVDDGRGSIRSFKSGEPCVTSLVLFARSTREMCLCKPFCAFELGCARLVECATTDFHVSDEPRPSFSPNETVLAQSGTGQCRTQETLAGKFVPNLPLSRLRRPPGTRLERETAAHSDH